ncbi:hypothetical protein Glove_60g74 [Diversispora epigaea]|uniref:Uncharacterized protein n=1 Tax=Diversispora epigaea TaxID=1348612 RepID=A0A397JIE5_9GLOM|nr:hypothetical protein Glove_60g71 [Diversispora epigaea]RHZ85736.1 hypothetical protein Glove_60g74 [Diversispora epigaea]
MVYNTTVQLVDIWDERLVPYCERDGFFESLQKTDEIYELLPQEVSRLQELYACQLRKKVSIHIASFKVHSDYWKKNREILVGPI